jgi:hypothetical protein
MLNQWEVCDRNLPFTITLDEAARIMQGLFDNYGKRSLAAERNEGVDFKAVSHAVRVGRQAIELLETGNIVFPRPDAENLMAIKAGRIDYRVVQPELEGILHRISELSESSALPEEVDRTVMDDLVLRIYGEDVAAFFAHYGT